MGLPGAEQIPLPSCQNLLESVGIWQESQGQGDGALQEAISQVRR